MVKDEAEILANVGNIDLTTYVNFSQLAAIARQNGQSKFLVGLLILFVGSDRGRTNAPRPISGVHGHRRESGEFAGADQVKEDSAANMGQLRPSGRSRADGCNLQGAVHLRQECRRSIPLPERRDHEEKGRLLRMNIKN